MGSFIQFEIVLIDFHCKALCFAVIFFEKKVFMEKILLAVYAAGNKGKTSAINEFAKSLKMKYKIADASVKQLRLTEHDETNIIFSFKNSNNQNIKIGIISWGDPKTKLDERLQECVNNSCDIIVTAARPNATNLEIRSISEYKIIWLQKSQLIFDDVNYPKKRGFLG